MDTGTRNRLRTLVEGGSDLLQAAGDPTTPPEELYRIWQVTSIPQAIRALARNPNTPPYLLGKIAYDYPEVVLRNPVLPLVLLEDPSLGLLFTTRSDEAGRLRLAQAALRLRSRLFRAILGARERVLTFRHATERIGPYFPERLTEYSSGLVMLEGDPVVSGGDALTQGYPYIQASVRVQATRADPDYPKFAAFLREAGWTQGSNKDVWTKISDQGDFPFSTYTG